ncbi:MAG TPA: hypothetical protein VLH77_02600 [Gammaproteobacteria bacterium]|nr:hypothetical protein [Gammaproteobacteria bacterium]
MNRYAASLIVFLILLFSPLSLFAKSITLYEEPKESAKQIGSLDPQAGIIAIYTPEKSDWIKVADPRDGKVGWVKVKDLGTTETTEFTFTQRYINTGKTPQSYQIIQFGGPNKMTPEQVQQQLKQIEQQQLQMQENLNKAIQNMITPWYNPGMPYVMPIIVVPAPNLPVDKNKPSDQSGSGKSGK